MLFGFLVGYLLAAGAEYVHLVRVEQPHDRLSHLSLAWEALIWPQKFWK